MHDAKHLFAMLFLSLVVFWLASVLRRVMQRGIRGGAVACGAALIGWVLLRIVKFQLPFGTVSRYCWYGYYLFLLVLPLIMVWLALHVGQEGRKNGVFVPFAALNSLLFLMVLLNDLHQLVFTFPDGVSETHYGYGAGYYLVFAVIMAETLFSMAALLVKSLRNPGRRSFWILLPMVILPLIYSVMYILRVPAAANSDLAVLVGIYAVLLFEALMYSGLVPVNTKYRALFVRSSLQMQIADTAGTVRLFSGGAALPPGAVTQRLSAPVSGGEIRWQEDVTPLHKLQTELREAIVQLEHTDRVLAQEAVLKRRSLRAQAREEIVCRLEAEISEKNATLSEMLCASPVNTVQAALLLCHIKRRCNLFFHESDGEPVQAETLMVYLDELAEFAAYAKLNVLTNCSLTAALPARQATLFYDFFYAALAAEIEAGGATVLEHLSADGKGVTMHLMLSAQGEWIESLRCSANRVGGLIAMKNLEESVGVTLSFPKGGAAE